MELENFIEYAEIIKKYKKVLNHFNYYIDTFYDNENSMILLTTENMFGESIVLYSDYSDFLSPEEVEEKINNDLVKLYNINHNE